MYMLKGLYLDKTFITFAPIWTFGKSVHKNRYAKFKKSAFGSAGWDNL